MAVYVYYSKPKEVRLVRIRICKRERGINRYPLAAELGDLMFLKPSGLYISTQRPLLGMIL